MIAGFLLLLLVLVPLFYDCRIPFIPIGTGATVLYYITIRIIRATRAIHVRDLRLEVVSICSMALA